MDIQMNLAQYCEKLQETFKEAFARFRETATLENAGVALTKANSLAFHAQSLKACKELLCEEKGKVESLRDELRRNPALTRNFAAWSILTDEVEHLLKRITEWQKPLPQA